MPVTLKNSTIIGISLALLVEAVVIGYFFLPAYFENPGPSSLEYLIIFIGAETAAIILAGWTVGAIMKNSTIDSPQDRRNVVFGAAIVAGGLTFFPLFLVAMAYTTK